MSCWAKHCLPIIELSPRVTFLPRKNGFCWWKQYLPWHVKQKYDPLIGFQCALSKCFESIYFTMIRTETLSKLTHWFLGEVAVIFIVNVWFPYKYLWLISWSISCEISLSWKPHAFIDDKSALAQVMVTSHYLTPCFDQRSPDSVRWLTGWGFIGNVDLGHHWPN